MFDLHGDAAAVEAAAAVVEPEHSRVWQIFTLRQEFLQL